MARRRRTPFLARLLARWKGDGEPDPSRPVAEIGATASLVVKVDSPHDPAAAHSHVATIALPIDIAITVRSPVESKEIKIRVGVDGYTEVIE